MPIIRDIDQQSREVHAGELGLCEGDSLGALVRHVGQALKKEGPKSWATMQLIAFDVQTF